MSTSFNCSFIKNLEEISQNPTEYFKNIEEFRSTGFNITSAITGVAFSIFSVLAAKNRAAVAIPIFLAGGWIIYESCPRKVITPEYTNLKGSIDSYIESLEAAFNRKRTAIYSALNKASVSSLADLNDKITFVSQVFEYEKDSKTWKGKEIHSNPIPQSDYQTLKASAETIVSFSGQVSKIEGIANKFKLLQEAAQTFLNGKKTQDTNHFNYVAYGLIDDKAIIHLA